jgi:hypothetical protein
LPDPAFFLSERVEGLLASLSAGRRPAGTSSFPSTITRENRGSLRCSQSEELADWFRRCVDEFCGGDLRGCEIEENLAIFAYLEWREPGTLSYASINLVCAECSLEDFYLTEDGSARAQYLRLDLDYGTLGPIFNYALPHVHAVCHEPGARFELDEIGSSNIVIDFLEFAHRNLQHDKWLRWARTVWQPYFTDRRSEFGDAMQTVIDSFTGNDINVLRRFSTEIREMRKLILERKQEAVDVSRRAFPVFDLAMDKSDRELLAFAVQGE